jgi:hypothetical protein
LRRFANPNKGFASAASLPKHRFRRKRDQGWQNVPERWRGNVQTEGLREAE